MRMFVFSLLCIAFCVSAGCAYNAAVKAEDPINCFDACKNAYERCQILAESNKSECIAQEIPKSKCDSNCIDKKSGCIDLKVNCQKKCL